MCRYYLLLLFLLAPPAAAQPTLIYESEPGLSLVELGELIPTFQGRFDFNGDGVRDLSFVRGDGLLDSLFVRDLTTNVLLARFSVTDVEQAMGSQDLRFLGYFDIDGNGQKEAAFFDRNAQVLGLTAQIEGTAHSKQATAAPFVLPARDVTVLDLDGDETPELIVANPETATVQIYGTVSTGTATDRIEAALASLLENYPNPFTTSTTIPYTVERPGPVTVRIYDLLGRTVRTLVQADRPAGTHRITWDGTDDTGRPVAAGPYLCRLRVGDTIVSHQTLLHAP
ncbi:MAG: T9SS type A sorting domain-containing protein [Bacteroidetes bacterium]|jgi:hypothetical protein|nr:T9SS type A sorting domain-containing protein [Bacteroidota bacterium]